jgi:hypothetical protein
VARVKHREKLTSKADERANAVAKQQALSRELAAANVAAAAAAALAGDGAVPAVLAPLVAAAAPVLHVAADDADDEDDDQGVVIPLDASRAAKARNALARLEAMSTAITRGCNRTSFIMQTVARKVCVMLA